MKTKIERLQKEIAYNLEKQKADAVVVVSPENVFYVSEVFIVSHRWIPQRLVMVIMHKQAPPTHIICNIHEGFVRSENSWIEDIRTYTEFVTSPIRLLVDVLEEKGLFNKKVLIETQHLTTKYFQELNDYLPDCEFGDCSPLMDQIRQVKTPEEIALLQENARLIERALLEVYKCTKPGDTEKEVAARAISNLVTVGYDTVDILTLCSGKTIFTNTKPGDYHLQKGDMLRIDLIGTRNGYRGDLFRQAVLGQANPEQAAGYRRYLEALNSIKKRIVIGTRPCDLYQACLREFENMGLRMDLPHIGHGIGVGLHEYPSISPTDKMPLTADMVLNLEPIGIDPGIGGFGQELTIQVTESGQKVISDYSELSRMFEIDI